MSRGATLSVLFSAAMLAGAALLPASARPSAATRPLVAAHRGGALLWPENSLLAFRNALDLGVDFVETDVHLTADGEVVVLHDPTLDRTTTGHGPVREARLADLIPLRLRDRSGRPTEEPIPTLAALLDVLAPSRAHLLLEIKVGADRARYAGVEEAALALVRGRNLASRTVVMGFESATIRRVRELDPTMRTTLLLGRGRIERERIAAADAVRLAKDSGATDLGVDHRALDGAMVDAVRQAGLRIAAWTVNDEPDIRRVVDLGVDIVISDRPDLAKRVSAR